MSDERDNGIDVEGSTALVQTQPASLPIRARDASPQVIALPPLGERTQRGTLRPTVGRSWSHWIVMAAGAAVLTLAVIAVVAFAGVRYRLEQGPISLAGLVPGIEAAINAEMGGLNVAIGDVILQADPGEVGFGLRLSDVRIEERATKTVLARAPLAAIDMSLAGLMAGRVAADEIELRRPRLRLVLPGPEASSAARSLQTDLDPALAAFQAGASNLDGRNTAFGLGQDRGADTASGVAPDESAADPLTMSRPIDVLAVVADTLARARRGTVASGYLRRLKLRDAQISVERSGVRPVALAVPRFTFTLEHRQKRSRLVGEGVVANADGDSELLVDIEESEKRRQLSLKAQFGQMPAPLLAAFADVPSSSDVTLDAALMSGQIRLDLTHEGIVTRARGDVRLDRGLAIGAAVFDDGLLVDGAAASVAYDGPGKGFTIEKLTVETPLGGIVGSGRIAPVASSRNGTPAWELAFDGSAPRDAAALGWPGRMPGRMTTGLSSRPERVWPWGQNTPATLRLPLRTGAAGPWRVIPTAHANVSEPARANDFKTLRLRGEVMADGSLFTLNELGLGFARGRLRLATEHGPGGSGGRLTLAAEQLRLRRALALWPHPVAPAVRAWVADRMDAAEVEKLNVIVAHRIDPIAGKLRTNRAGSGASAQPGASGPDAGTGVLGRSYGWLADGSVTVETTLKHARFRPVPDLPAVIAPHVQVTYLHDTVAVRAPRLVALTPGASMDAIADLIAGGRPGAKALMHEAAAKAASAEKQAGAATQGGDGRPPLPRAKPGRRDQRLATRGGLLRDADPTVILTDVRFDLPEAARGEKTLATLGFKMSGGLDKVVAAVGTQRLGLDRIPRDLINRARGRVAGDLRLALDLKADRVTDTTGTVRVSGLSLPSVVPGLNIAGSSVRAALADGGVQATGDLLVNGVPARASFLRFANIAEHRQPGLTVVATLDEADRRALGIGDIDGLKGPVAVEVRRQAGPGPGSDGASQQTWRLAVDLSDATIDILPLDYAKQAGQKATLEAALARPDMPRPVPARAGGGGVGLRVDNLRLTSPNLALSGRLTIDGAGRVATFDLPEISLNVVTQFAARGEREPDGLWRVNITGRSFDARGSIKTLFTQTGKPAGAARSGAAAQDGVGLDLNANIGAVIGFADATLSNLRLRIQKRRGRLTAFESFGDFERGRRLGVRLVQAENGTREILAETDDAGSAFRFAGLYQSIRGGRASLKLNLDGSGSAEKAGTLWARSFAISNSRVVDQVISDVPRARAGFAAAQAQRGDSRLRDEPVAPRLRRNQIAFDQLYLPFTVGAGRLSIYNAFINGPVLGATLRGQVNFRNRRVDVGGTYVPLYGINAALGAMPVIGQLFVGRRGEGVLGLSYAVKGAIENPNVVVNPMTMVTPGIFRQIFEFRPPAPPPGIPGGLRGAAPRVQANRGRASRGARQRTATGDRDPASLSSSRRTANATLDDDTDASASQIYGGISPAELFERSSGSDRTSGAIPPPREVRSGNAQNTPAVPPELVGDVRGDADAFNEPWQIETIE